MTTKKPGAKKGNKNAQKFESTPTPILFKAPAEDIKKWQKKADQAGVSRSEWIRGRLNGLTLHSASDAKARNAERIAKRNERKKRESKI